MMKRLIVTILSLGVISLTSLISFTPVAQAVSGSDWKSGNIIDDALFYDNTSMSAADIQVFMNARVPSCDTNGTQPASEYGRSDLTHAQYAATRGWSGPPYVCLRDYYQVPRGDQNINNLNTNVVPTGAISAAQIIKNAADTHGISPKALLAILQKESPGPLLSDTWPLANQYRNAMGYGCPDTAPCDPSYEGFYNQMMNAAWQFKSYKNNSGSFRYKPFQVNNIYYHPSLNTAPNYCNSSDVTIENYATAGLYNYTPYQPNQAALNNLYGTGNDCSAYGNRNFWRLFNDWFGSTRADQYSWSLTNQYAYTDDSKTTGIGLSSLKPGQRVYIGITAKNTGSATWLNTGTNPVRIGTSRSYERKSQFFDNTWLGQTRPATMKEASVAPGETATFDFWITVPESYQGSFKEYFNLLSEGRAWMNDIGMYFSMTVEQPRYTWDLTSQYAYTDESKTTPTGLGNMEPLQRKYVGITIKNTGNMTWSNTGANPVRLGASNGYDRASALADSSWLNTSRPATMKESTVAPGQTATFEFWLISPIGRTGDFKEYFTPLSEGKVWFQNIGLNFSGNSITPRYTWDLTSQYAYTDESKTTPMGLNLSKGQMAYVGFTAKNTGNLTWYRDAANAVDTGTSSPYDRLSAFCTNGWLGCNRPARMKEPSVAPGQTATFEYWIKAPTTPGDYREYVNLVSEGAAWMQNIGLNFTIRVN